MTDRPPTHTRPCASYGRRQTPSPRVHSGTSTPWRPHPRPRLSLGFTLSSFPPSSSPAEPHPPNSRPHALLGHAPTTCAPHPASIRRYETSRPARALALSRLRAVATPGHNCKTTMPPSGSFHSGRVELPCVCLPTCNIACVNQRASVTPLVHCSGDMKEVLVTCCPAVRG